MLHQFTEPGEPKRQTFGRSPSATINHLAFAATEHADPIYARQDTVDALRLENEALREETSAMRAQMADILKQLNALATQRFALFAPVLCSDGSLTQFILFYR